MPPCVQGSRQGKTVYALYRNTALLLADFWDYFGRMMARINRTWPLCAFGTAENQETVRLTAQANEDSIELVQQTISGESTEVLRTLCFQIECTDSAAADKLLRYLETMNWQTYIKAVGWNEADFPREQGLIMEPGRGIHFCYTGLKADVTVKDLLESLDFDQKAVLWTTFLKDGFEPLEFEWMAEKIAEESLDNRMEWELALREAMEQLHFRIVNRDKEFEVYDGAGERRYFGADRRHPAEWAFLKILFPLND